MSQDSKQLVGTVGGETVYVVLPSGVVVDRSQLVLLPSDDVQAVFSALTTTFPLKLRVVDRFTDFFTSTNMLALIEANNDDYKLVAEKTGITIIEAEVAAMQRAVELRKEITEKMKPPVPPYPFAKLPYGWEFDKKLKITADGEFRAIKRVDGPYKLGMVQARKLWDKLSPWWAKNPMGGLGPSVEIIYGGACYVRSVSSSIDDNFRIRVGCESIERFELEMLALNQNWPFPVPQS